MSRYPGARWRPIARNLGTMDRHDGGIDHTYVGSPSPDSAFARFNVPNTPTPHFMFFRDGSVDQYIDTRFRSSACLDGNHRLITWETADGFPGLWSGGQAPKDTPAMVKAKAKLMAWLHTEHGIPLTRMTSSKPLARGFGWHRLGIDGNFPQAPGQLLGGRVPGGEHWSTSVGKTCPTDRRIHQFVEETIPAAVALAKPKPPPPPSSTDATWFYNLRVGRSQDQVTKEQRAILSKRPRAVGYCEAVGYRIVDDPDYITVRDTSTKSRANIAAHIAKDVGVRKFWWIDLKQTWPRTHGPGQHEPRSILVILLKTGRYFVVAHAPQEPNNRTDTRAAREEFVRHLTRAVNRWKRPVEIVADWNGTGKESTSAQTVAGLVHGKAVGKRIDAAVVRDIEAGPAGYPTKVTTPDGDVPLKSDHGHALRFKTK